MELLILTHSLGYTKLRIIILYFLLFQDEVKASSTNSSSLTFVPRVSDHEKELRCVVDNPILDKSEIEDSVVLQVHCEY